MNSAYTERINVHLEIDRFISLLTFLCTTKVEYFVTG